MDWIVKRGMVKIPDCIPFAQAVFVEPLNTCLKGVRSLHLSLDETVLVIGQGPIGIMLALSPADRPRRCSRRICTRSGTP